MIVQCSGCAAKLKIKDEKIKPQGSSFKCPRCSKVLFVQKPLSTGKKSVKDTYKHQSVQEDKSSRGFMRHPAEKERAKTSNFINFFAVLLMFIIITSVGTFVWARIQRGKIGGPDHISVLDNNVYIHMNRTLYHLNAAGELIDSVKLADLGIKGRSSDIQLLSDGTMLVGDWDSGTIKRCDIERLNCYTIAPAGGEALGVPFKFFADEPSGKIYIIDTSRHKLLVQDIEGKSIRKLAGIKTLLFPNDLLVDNDGLIHIANTNRHHIVTFKLDGERARKIDTPVKGRNTLGRSGQYWPVALAKSPQGDWWILNADTHMKDADLIIYDKLGQARHRIKLPDKADPIEIAWTGDKVLVTDSRLLKVYEVNSETRKISDFGNSVFQSELKKITDNKEKYKRTIGLSFYILFGAFIGALVLSVFAIIDRRKKSKEVSQQIPPTLETGSDRPLIWNPNAAAYWSLIFSPAFGAILHAINWKALGQPDKAKGNKIWAWAIIIFLLLIAVIPPNVINLEIVENVLSSIGGIGLFVGWYVSQGRVQTQYVKEKYGKEYNKRRWAKPLLIALASVLGYVIFIVVVTLIYNKILGIPIE